MFDNVSDECDMDMAWFDGFHKSARGIFQTAKWLNQDPDAQPPSMEYIKKKFMGKIPINMIYPFVHPFSCRTSMSILNKVAFWGSKMSSTTNTIHLYNYYYPHMFSIPDSPKAMRGGLVGFQIIVPDEKASEFIPPYTRQFGYGDLRGYVLADQTYPLSRGWVGLAPDDDMLLVNEDELTIQHELQHLFDHTVLTGTSGGGRVQLEYRAKLAEIAFGGDPQKAYAEIEAGANRFVRGSKHHQQELAAAKDALGHGRANVLVRENLSGVRPGNLQAVAVNLLDSTYLSSCGLGYREIIAPYMMEQK